MQLQMDLDNHDAVGLTIPQFMAEINKKLLSISKDSVADELKFRRFLQEQDFKSISSQSITPSLVIWEYEEWITEEAKKICRSIFDRYYQKMNIPNQISERVWSSHLRNHKKFKQLKKYSEINPEHLFDVPKQVQMAITNKRPFDALALPARLRQNWAAPYIQSFPRIDLILKEYSQFVLASILSFEKCYEGSGDKLISHSHFFRIESGRGFASAVYFGLHLSRLNLLHPLSETSSLHTVGGKTPVVPLNLNSGSPLKAIVFTDISAAESQPFKIQIIYEPYWKRNFHRFKNPYNMLSWPDSRLLTSAYRDARSCVFKAFDDKDIDLWEFVQEITLNPILAFSSEGKIDSFFQLQVGAPKTLFDLIDWMEYVRNSFLDQPEELAIFVDSLYSSIEKFRPPPIASALSAYYMKTNEISFIGGKFNKNKSALMKI